MTHAQYLCQVSGRSEWVEWARGCWNEGMSQRGGWSACIAAPSVQRSIALLCRTPGSKSLYPHMLLRLWRITVGIQGLAGGEVGVCTSLCCWSISPSLCCVRIPALSHCWVHIHMCCHISGTSTCIVVGQHITMWVHKPVTCTIRARAENSRCTLPFPKQRGDKVITR